MKKKLIIITIVIVGIAAASLWYLNTKKSEKNTSSGTATNSNSEERGVEVIASDTYHRGVLIRAYGLGEYKKDNLLKQMQLAKELGATDVRANLEADDKVNDDFVELAISEQLKPVLIVEPPLDDFFNTASYDIAYKFASKYAKRYKGKVGYYQLANEASGVNIKPNYPGDKKTDYDPKKYSVFLNWVKGLSSGIYDNDPDAKRIVSAHWLGVGIIDKLVEDGVHFEVIGWNWYDDMGESLVKKTSDGSTLNIPDYLSKYKKDFWVIELNRHSGTFDGNYAAQSDYLLTFISNIAKEKLVTGVYIYPLTDICQESSVSGGHMGLVKVNKSSGGNCTIGDKKISFTTIQKLFSGTK